MGHPPTDEPEDEPTAEESEQASVDFLNMVHRGFMGAFVMKVHSSDNVQTDFDTMLAGAFAMYALEHSVLPISKALPEVRNAFLARVEDVVDSMERPFKDDCDCSFCNAARSLYESADQRHAEIQVQLARDLLQATTDTEEGESEDGKTQTWRH